VRFNCFRRFSSSGFPRAVLPVPSSTARAGRTADFSANAEITASPQDLTIDSSITYEWQWNCPCCRCDSADRSNVTLKIEKYSDGNSTTIRLIGQMHAEDLPELQKQIRASESKIALDLEELKLVDVDAVRFLGGCEARGAVLLNCSPYIRDWIGKERD